MLRIELLDHRDLSVARRIHAVLMLAHAQEAEVIQTKHPTALSHTVEAIQASAEFYLGALRAEELLGALSVGPDDEPGQINIALLVVAPRHQRQGIGRLLIVEALRRGQGAAFCVSTTAGNAPALSLYQELGFLAYRHGTLGAEAIALVKLRRLP
jgi:ribosomal protein S18 acetylase RimI-like enzyme